MFKLLLIFTFFLTAHGLSREFFITRDSTGRVIRRPIRSTLLGWNSYIRTIAQDFVYEIEDFGLCNFILADFTQNISRDFFGYEVNGTVKYSRGFIGTIQKVLLQDQAEMYLIDESSQTSEVKSKLIFEHPMLYFDFAANLTKTYFSGTVAIPIKSMEFSIKIVNDYRINKIEGFIHDAHAQIPYKDMRWYFEPSNTYTEIIDRDVQWSFFDDLQRFSNTTMKKLLNNVIKKHVYPKLCLDCNDKMKISEYNLKEQENY